MNWQLEWSLLEAHFEAVVAHFEGKRNAWSRKVDRRRFLHTVLQCRDVYAAARPLNLSPPRVHELADAMYRHAQRLDGKLPGPRAKYPELLPFADRLKRARKARELDAKAMARLAGMGIVNYHMVERGDRNPRLLSVMRMAKALVMTVGQLADGEP